MTMGTRRSLFPTKNNILNCINDYLFPKEEKSTAEEHGWDDVIKFEDKHMGVPGSGIVFNPISSGIQIDRYYPSTRCSG